MSVINKMLRDLDQRQATAQPAHHQPAGVAPGTAPVGRPSSGGNPARRWLLLGLLMAVAAVAVAAALWWQSGGQLSGSVSLASAPPVAPPAAQTAALPTAPPVSPASAPASTPEAVPPALSGPEAPKATESAAVQPDASGAMVLRMEPSLSARRALDALLSTPAPAPSSVVAAAPAAPERSKPRSAAASAPAVVASNVPTLVGDSTPVLQRQQQAGGDALAQAQALWASGSRDAAIDLVLQSIAVAERAAKSAGGTGTNPVLLPLVRELARMQLAEGRYGVVWETLVRLEPLLGNQSDLWAIRANAAQRLGRHPDSVHAYMMALQSRPDEQRWLLGAAVSLAALGQTTSSAEMADKARAQGPVSKDILAYLRQAGVPLKD